MSLLTFACVLTNLAYCIFLLLTYNGEVTAQIYCVFLFISGLPPGCQRALEAMSQELGDLNPAFTIRRQLQHAQEEMEQIEQLRNVG
jgi:hypothetical protein